jgi:hypothetical protein
MILRHLPGYASNPFLKGSEPPLPQQGMSLPDDEADKIAPVLPLTVEFSGIFKPARTFQKLARLPLDMEHLLGGKNFSGLGGKELSQQGMILVQRLGLQVLFRKIIIPG